MLFAALLAGPGMVLAGGATGWELLFAAPLTAAAAGLMVVAGGAAGCALLFAAAPLAAATGPGPGMVLEGGAAWGVLLFAAQLDAVTVPGPGMVTRVSACLDLFVISKGAPTRRLPSTLPSLAGGPGAGRGGGTGAATTIICYGRFGGDLAGGTAAAAGSRRECWWSPRCSTSSPSPVL